MKETERLYLVGIGSIPIVGPEPLEESWRGRSIAADCGLHEGGMVSQVYCVWMTLDCGDEDLVPMVVLPKLDADLV